MVIVLPPSPFLLELGLRSNFQKWGGGFTGSPCLEGIAGKEGGGGDFFQGQGELEFLQKIKLKSKIFIDKKSL